MNQSAAPALPSPEANARLSGQLGAQARAARLARGLSIRAAAGQFGCSPRFLQELEQGKPTARMDKVLQVLSRLGLQLGVGHAGAPDRAGARARQALHEEALARAHDLIAARLALGAIPHADIERARAQVRKWADQQICSRWYVDRWSRLLSGSDREIAARMIALRRAEARALHQNTPFGFLVREAMRA